AAFLTSYRHVRPDVTGDDLVKLGFRSGPGLHRALDVLRRARLDGLVGNRDEEKEYVRLYLSGMGPGGQDGQEFPEVPDTGTEGSAGASGEDEGMGGRDPAEPLTGFEGDGI
ncbi:MAG: hypothetical protein LBG06_09040, partial [Deltaproteobacteria bacterium]|nr:hypothetical protein [Deltaproteobacteria bacterium]